MENSLFNFISQSPITISYDFIDHNDYNNFCYEKNLNILIWLLQQRYWTVYSLGIGIFVMQKVKLPIFSIGSTFYSCPCPSLLFPKYRMLFSFHLLHSCCLCSLLMWPSDTAWVHLPGILHNSSWEWMFLHFYHIHNTAVMSHNVWTCTHTCTHAYLHTQNYSGHFDKLTPPNVKYNIGSIPTLNLLEITSIVERFLNQLANDMFF